MLSTVWKRNKGKRPIFSVPYTEDANKFHLYQITANSGTPGSTTYVERQIQATIAK